MRNLQILVMPHPGFKQDPSALLTALGKHKGNFDLILADIREAPYHDIFLFAYNVSDIFDDNSAVINAMAHSNTGSLQQVADNGLQSYQHLMQFVSGSSADAWRYSASRKLERLLRSPGSGGQGPVDESFGPGVTPAADRILTPERLVVLQQILSTNSEFFMHDSPFWEANYTHSGNFDLMLVDLKPRTYYDRLIFGYKIGEIFEDNPDAASEISRMDYERLQALAEDQLYSFRGFYRTWSDIRAENWRVAASPRFSELIRSMVSENEFEAVEPANEISLDTPIGAEATPGEIRLLTDDRLQILKMLAVNTIPGDEGDSGFWTAVETHYPNFDLVLQDLEHTSYYHRLIFAYQIGDIFMDNPRAADQVQELGYTQLREVAESELESYLAALDFQSGEAADTWMTTATNKLFHIEPSAILKSMIRDGTITIDSPLRQDVLRFFQNQPDFNIREVSIDTAANTPDAFEDIGNQEAVLQYLRMLQRTQALTRIPSAIPVLIAKGFTSAVAVAFRYLNAFVADVSPLIEPMTAATIHGRAVRILNRNESAMTRLLESVQGTNLAALDGTATAQDRIRLINHLGGAQFTNINLETLFGSMDTDPCDDCNSVNSPAAYFVELLEFLRSNNLEAGVGGSNSTDVEGTVLGHFFARRPDLGNLELSCPNTNAVLPYLDLANEVMESFVVHLDEQVLYQPMSGPAVVHTVLDVYNTRPTDGELLSEPQVCYAHPH